MPCWTEAGLIFDGPWVVNKSSKNINVKAFSTFLETLENETLRRTFERIKRYLEAQDKVGPASAVMLSPFGLLLQGNLCCGSDDHDAIL